MSELNALEIRAILDRIRSQAAAGEIRLTQHAQQEMVEENIKLDNVLDAIGTGKIVENYPQHRRGACCLLTGLTREGRSIHVVCTTAQTKLIVVTAYEPKPPKWITPSKRRALP